MVTLGHAVRELNHLEVVFHNVCLGWNLDLADASSSIMLEPYLRTAIPGILLHT